MVSQDLIYSVLPRQTGQVEHKNRMVEKVVTRSSLKSTDEHDSAPSDTAITTPKRRRGDRRRGDRRRAPRTDEQSTTTAPQPREPSPDDDNYDGLDLFV